MIAIRSMLLIDAVPDVKNVSQDQMQFVAEDTFTVSGNEFS